MPPIPDALASAGSSPVRLRSSNRAKARRTVSSSHHCRKLLDNKDLLAEGEGFEPPVRFPVQRFSRPPVSTTHTSLRAKAGVYPQSIATPFPPCRKLYSAQKLMYDALT